MIAFSREGYTLGTINPSDCVEIITNIGFLRSDCLIVALCSFQNSRNNTTHHNTSHITQQHTLQQTRTQELALVSS
jgi:hypothetical protein